MNSDPYVGEIAVWTGQRIPRGWALCDGSKLSISANTALFALLGNRFGGDGIKDFALPDLRGVTIVGVEPVTGGPYELGKTGGVSDVWLSEANLPQHNHAFGVTSAVGSIEPIVDAIPATVNGSTFKYYTGAPDTAVSPMAIAPPEQAGRAPHPNMQPYLVLNYIIATDGFFPVHT